MNLFCRRFDDLTRQSIAMLPLLVTCGLSFLRDWNKCWYSTDKLKFIKLSNYGRSPRSPAVPKRIGVPKHHRGPAQRLYYRWVSLMNLHLKAFIYILLSFLDLKKLMKYHAKLDNRDKEHDCMSCRSIKCGLCNRQTSQGQTKSSTTKDHNKLSKSSGSATRRVQSATTMHSGIEAEKQKSKMCKFNWGFCKLGIVCWLCLFSGIRPMKPHQTFKTDPVALFSNYQKDWDKFKNMIPGENKRLDLRWAIRERMN